jgi:Cu/Ag efflux protein CusF
MKLHLTRHMTALALTLALLHGTAMLRADEATAKARTSEGTLAAVDASGKTLILHGWLGSLASKKFHLAEDAAIVTGLGRSAALGDLKPGMEVRVHYQSADGVRVATRIEQRVHESTSFVKAVDPQAQKLTVEKARLEKTFWLTEDTRVVLHGKTARPADLKPGQRVTVNYVRNGVALVAKSVEDSSELFAGTIEAIDAERGTVTLKHLLSRRTFTLGDACRIVVGDLPKATLRDLRIGDRATVSYRDVQGVLIAAHIAAGGAQQPVSEAESASAVP